MAFNDLCECLYSFIQRQMREVNGVIESNNGHTVFTDRGFSSASEAFSLPQNNNVEVSNTMIVTTVFIGLMITMLLTMRGSNNQIEDPSTQKPQRDREFDEKKDRDFLQ
uniref:Uncharacterized protein n=1 Tax=Bigelowiella natans TaxID=227086 RepID=A0A6U3E3Q9_BIGNA|mmetsp:Transcript_12108/g.14372  ORF Transcript_12108/g.14372 Transcript_12108/m.14372 type:complete len:109 (+) Transcript_12108:113-439(+)